MLEHWYVRLRGDRGSDTAETDGPDGNADMLWPRLHPSRASPSQWDRPAVV
jgi:hypothetical protein